MFYSLLRTLLFALPPEVAHRFSLNGLKWAHQWGFLKPCPPKVAEVKIMDLVFPNRVGLAAGLDKNGEYVDALAALGFGAIEIGTVTPRAQPGNPKPRLFRLPQADALINRLGFNNHGVDYLCQQLQQIQFRGILGINIGKNFDTPLEHAKNDYVIALNKVYPYASYVVINISSPNTPGLRQLHYGNELMDLLGELKKSQMNLAKTLGKYVPLVIKIAPDLTPEQITELANALLSQGMDGVIATNTTLAREGVSHLAHGDETGGLSGRPLFEKSLSVVRQLHAILQERIPIIGCGGIASVDDMERMLEAGAKIVQVYTALIYQGPSFIQRLTTSCLHKKR